MTRPGRQAQAPRRVLFVSESVTLAQVVRLASLAESLDADRYEVHFASGRFPPGVLEGSRTRRWPLWTVSARHVDDCIARGRRIYDRRTLERYVEDDLEIIEEVRPDLVVGDLRWSLSISAPRAGVPYAALANAYWSPLSRLDGIPLPEHPIVRVLGTRIAAAWFPLAIPYVFSHFARPLNELRLRHGLASLGSLREVVTHGDFTLFADCPELVPTGPLPSHQRFVGPVSWSPAGELPDDWGRDRERPGVYVTLGSSGDLSRLPIILTALSTMRVDVLVATAGRVDPSELPAGARHAHYVPGDRAAERASLVITNGGSSSGYQALAAGTPVLGIPYNLDQYLATAAIVRTGAGASLRSGLLEPGQVRAAVADCLVDRDMRQRAAELGKALASYDAQAAFRRFVPEVLGADSVRRTG